MLRKLMPCIFSISIATSLYANPVEGPYIGITANQLNANYDISAADHTEKLVLTKNKYTPGINIGYRWAGTSISFNPEFSVSPGYTTKTWVVQNVKGIKFKTNLGMNLNLHIGYMLSERAAARLSLGLLKDKVTPVVFNPVDLNGITLKPKSTSNIKFGFGLEYAYSPRLLIHMDNTIMPAKKIKALEGTDYNLVKRSENITKIGLSYFF